MGKSSSLPNIFLRSNSQFYLRTRALAGISVILVVWKVEMGGWLWFGLAAKLPPSSVKDLAPGNKG